MAVNIRPEIQDIENTIISTRRDIHQHPELAFEEHRTAKLVADHLESLGIDVQTGVGKTGVVGILKGKNTGKTIALRADMDALPMQETSDVPYKSKNDGVMHACGHDGHTAMLLGAAEILSKNREKLNGTVKFLFQPAEEGQGGARYMIKDGALEGVDEVYGIHLWNYQEFGTLGVKPGPIMAAADLFEITIHGKGGHGATPQGTKDAVVISSHLVQTLQTIVSRNTNPIESTVVTIGQINGGYNFNIIADTVNMKGTARAYTEENRQLIKTRMAEVIKGTEQIFSCKIDFDYEDGYPPTINDPDAADTLLNAAQKIVGEGAGYPYLSMGGEDFSYMLQEVPGCFFLVGSSPMNREPLSVPHHCSHFDIDEQALLVGSSVYLQIVDDLLMKG
ncbi:MAG: amidohydrolase [Candidatus Marinimicrobia bacterium]|jgi:amidohydrolase|nr:amidohydrolase [Candidatus Neomarinimicrobiota bacterium]